jgi:FKBP-type peptidyl-prolyl cis-trans isomerase FklB
VIPSAQAYGEEGAGDLSPPYSPLVFELELLDTKE